MTIVNLNDVTHAAILYHAEADWTGGANQYAGTVGRVLAEHQADYHFIPADVFGERNTYHTIIDPERHCLCVNHQAYRAFIVPEAGWISAPAADALEEMERVGIPVLYIHARPQGVCAKQGEAAREYDLPGKVVKMSDLPAVCNEYLLMQAVCEPTSAMIRCLHYCGADYDLYYLLNEAAEAWRGSLQLMDIPSGSLNCYEYDAWKNSCKAVELRGATISTELEPTKGRLYLFDRSADTRRDIAVRHLENSSRSLIRWTRSVCKAIDYPEFVEAKEVTLPDAYEREDPDFGGFIRYETVLVCGHKPEGPVILEICGQQEGIEVLVNGVSAGIQIVPVYRFEIGSLLKKGRNTIRIEQATTLERVIRNVRSVSAQPIEPKNHVGIDREIVLRGRESDLQMIITENT